MVCLIMLMIFETMTDAWINTSVTCNITSGAIYNIQVTLIILHNNIALHNVKWHVQNMRWVIKYCGYMFVCVGNNNPNVFTTVRISIYIHKIPHGRINPISYNIIWVSHCRANMCKVTSRRIHSWCTKWYAFPFTEKICVW